MQCVVTELMRSAVESWTSPYQWVLMCAAGSLYGRHKFVYNLCVRMAVECHYTRRQSATHTGVRVTASCFYA